MGNEVLAFPKWINLRICCNCVCQLKRMQQSAQDLTMATWEVFSGWRIICAAEWESLISKRLVSAHRIQQPRRHAWRGVYGARDYSLHSVVYRYSISTQKRGFAVHANRAQMFFFLYIQFIFIAEAFKTGPNYYHAIHFLNITSNLNTLCFCLEF